MSKFVSDIDEATEALHEQIEVLKEKANTVIEPYKSLLKYPDKKDYKWSLSNNMFGTFNLRTECYFNTSSYGYYNWDKITQESVDRALKVFDEAFDKWKQDAQKIKEQNEEIIKHNKIQCDRVKLLMETLGVRETYRTFEYKTSRSRKKTEMKKVAGWKQDLNRVVPLSDSYGSELRKIEAKRREIEEFGKKKVQEANTKRAEEEKKQAEQAKVRELALLQVKYGLDASSEADDILEIILSKNKYLRLAHYLELNRGNWMDGYDYAETGIDGFTEEDEVDRAIVADITSYFEDFNDGRVFRDCEYSYGVLFGMVKDEDLYEDYLKVKSMVNHY